jgi:hypothetical protein
VRSEIHAVAGPQRLAGRSVGRAQQALELAARDEQELLAVVADQPDLIVRDRRHFELKRLHVLADERAGQGDDAGVVRGVLAARPVDQRERRLRQRLEVRVRRNQVVLARRGRKEFVRADAKRLGDRHELFEIELRFLVLDRREAGRRDADSRREVLERPPALLSTLADGPAELEVGVVDGGASVDGHERSLSCRDFTPIMPPVSAVVIQLSESGASTTDFRKLHVKQQY